MALTNYAHANPQDGTVAAGRAQISSAGSTLTVNQQSDRAVINWRNFDIGEGETTAFRQPGKNSIAVNRVNSDHASDIEGRLTANGNVVVINQNGVLFGTHSTVNVNGLIATTADVDPRQVMKGGPIAFNKPGNPNASIVNNGSITAGQAGLVGFVAPTVVNNGVIAAKMGRIHLAAGDTATVDMYGDHLMEVAVSDKVKSQLAVNTGTLQADGGTVAMTAAAGGKIIDSLISERGTLQAQSVGQQNGTIVIGAGGTAANPNVAANNASSNARVEITGTLDASGRVTGGRGGSITVTGDSIALKSTARLDASGDTGGGQIRVGGDWHGQGTLKTAKTVDIASGATIRNDAVSKGNGGDTVVWSNGATSFWGGISARGGAQGGNGGNAEVSGHDTLLYAGRTDLRADKGSDGTFLLDPTDITISNAADSAGNTNTSGTFTNGTTASSNLNVNTLLTQLGLSNVTVSTASALTANGDITVANAINWSSGKNLTLTSDRDIVVNAGITGSGNAQLVMNAGRNLNVNAALSLAAGGIVATAGQNIDFNANVGASSALISATATKNLTVEAGKTITNSGNGNTYLYAANNVVGNVGQLLMNGNLSLGTGAFFLTSGTDSSGNRANLSLSSSNLTTAATVGAVSINGFYDTTISQALNGNNYLSINSYRNLTVGNVASSSAFYITLSAANGQVANTGLLTLNGTLSVGTHGNGLTLTSGVDTAGNRNDLTLDNAHLTQLGTGGTMGRLVANGFRDVNLNNNITAVNNVQVTAYRNINVASGATIKSGAAYGVSLVAANNVAGGTGSLNLAGKISNGSNAFTLFSGLSTSTAAPVNLTLNSSNFEMNNTTAGTVSVSGFQDIELATNLAASGALTLKATRNLTIDSGVTLTGGTSTTNLNAANGVTSGTGVFTLNGKLNLGSNSLSIYSGLDSTSTAADLTLNSSNLGYVGSTAGAITLGGFRDVNVNTSLTSNAAINIRALRNLTIASGTTITTAGTGALNLQAANAATGALGQVLLNGNLNIGSGTLTLTSGLDGGGNAADLTLNSTNLVYNNGAVNGISLNGFNKINATADLLSVNSVNITGKNTITLGNVQYGGASASAITTTNSAVTLNGTLNDVSAANQMTIASGNAALTINGAVGGVNAVNNLILNSDNVVLNNDLTGTGTVQVANQTRYRTMGVGDGAAGMQVYGSSFLNHIKTGWAQETFSSDDGNLDVKSYAWTNSLNLQSNIGVTTVEDAIAMGNHNLTFSARSTLTFNAPLSGTGTLTFQGGTSFNGISIGSNAPSGVSIVQISDSDLAQIQTGWGLINFSAGSSLTYATVAPYRFSSPVQFVAGLNGTGQTLNIQSDLLAASGSNASFTFTGANNATASFTGNIDTTAATSGGGVTFSNLASVSLPASIKTNNAGITINNTVTGTALTKASTLNAGTGTVTLASPLSGAYDFAVNAGTIGFGAGALTSSALGNVSLTSVNALALPSMSAASITARTTGSSSDLSLNSGSVLTASGSGNAIILAAGRNFINNAGTGALAAASGRWLLYSTNPAANTLGGLTSAFNRYSCTYGGSCPTLGSGNGLLYNYTPLLTATANPTALSITYGDVTPNLNGYNYILSGYLGSDNSADTVTGSLNGTTAYHQGNNAGSYNVDYSSGNLASTLGYGFSYANSSTALTVNKRNVTASFTGNLNKTYGDANPTVDYSNFNFTNLYGTDARTLFTSVTPNFGSVNADSNVGTYAGITAAIADTTNYHVTSTPSTSLVVSKRALTVSTDNKSKTYGDANPTFTGSIGNLTSHDAGLVGWTYNPTGYAGNAGSYTITATASDASNRLANYTITETDGTFSVAKRNVTAGFTGNLNKTYGDANPTVDYSNFNFSNLAGSDNGSLFTSVTPSFGSINADSNVGTYAGITAAIADTTNYHVTNTPSTSLIIGKRALTVTTDNKSKTYGDADPTFTGSIGNLTSHDSSLVGWTYAPTGYAGNAGSYTIAATAADSSSRLANYTITETDGTFAVSKRNVTASFTGNLNKTYGDANPTVDYSNFNFSNLAGSDNKNLFTSVTPNFGSVNADSNVGTYTGITAAIADTTNYHVTSTPSTSLVVSKRALTVSTDNKTKIYGDADPTFTGSIGNLTTHDAGLVGWTYAPTGYAGNAGSYTIAATASDASNRLANYTITETDGTLAVSKRDVTASFTGNLNKTYGDANPTIDYTNFNFSNLVGSDTSSLFTSATPNFGSITANSNAGTYTGITAAIADTTNYHVTSTPSTSLIVGKRALTVSTDNKNKTYGDADPTFTGTIGNMTSNDAGLVGWTYAPTGYAGNAGSYTIAATASDASNRLANYTIAETDGIFAVAKRDVTASFTGNLTKTYGDNNPTVDYTNFNFSNMAGSDGKSLFSSITPDFGSVNADSNVGTYAGITAAIADTTNYHVTSTPSTSLIVSKRALTVSTDNKTKTYGDADPTFTGSIGNMTSNDAGLVGWTYAPTGYAGNAGSYTIAATASDASNRLANYTISESDGTFAVSRREVTASFTGNLSKTYGDANPTVDYTNFNFSNMAGSDNGSLFTSVTPNYGALDANSNAGTYTGITAAIADTTNYHVTNAPSTSLVVGKRALTISTDNKNKTYGDVDPTFTGSIGNLTSHDSGLVGWTYAPTGYAGNAGSYTIAATASDASNRLANYTIAETDGTLTVAKRNVTASFTGNLNKTYGDANPTVDYTNFNFANLAGSDSRTLFTSVTPDFGAITADSNAGTYGGITASIADTANYHVTNAPSTSLIIAKRTLTVSTDDKNKTYGDADPTFTGSVANMTSHDAGLVGWSYAPTGYAGNAGSYAITATASDPSSRLGNYTINETDGTFAVAKRDVTASFTGNLNKTYGDANPIVDHTNFNFANLAGSDTSSLFTSVTPNFGSITADSNAGTYTGITAAIADTTNYHVTSTPSTSLVVAKRALTVATDDKNKTYGDANPIFSGTVGNLTTHDAGLVGWAYAPTGYVGNAGSYKIKATASDASNRLANYTITETDGTFAVSKRDVTASFTGNLTKTYGDANPTVTYTNFNVSNLAGADGRNLFTSITPDFGAIGANSNAGTYTGITAAIADTTNYHVMNTPSTSLVIGKRDLTVTTADKNKTYGDADPTFTGAANLTAYDTGLVSWTYAPAGYAGNAGTYTVAATANDPSSRLANYNVTDAFGHFEVAKRGVSVTINDVAIDDHTLLAALNKADGAEMTWSNLAGADTPGMLGSVVFGYGGATPGQTNAAGSHILSIASLTDGNYTLSHQNVGHLTITALDPPPPPPIQPTAPASVAQATPLPDSVRHISQNPDTVMISPQVNLAQPSPWSASGSSTVVIDAAPVTALASAAPADTPAEGHHQDQAKSHCANESGNRDVSKVCWIEQ